MVSAPYNMMLVKLSIYRSKSYRDHRLVWLSYSHGTLVTVVVTIYV